MFSTLKFKVKAVRFKTHVVMVSNTSVNLRVKTREQRLVVGFTVISLCGCTESISTFRQTTKTKQNCNTVRCLFVSLETDHANTVCISTVHTHTNISCVVLVFKSVRHTYCMTCSRACRAPPCCCELSAHPGRRRPLPPAHSVAG